MHIETAHTVVRVTQSLRDLLKIMNFPEIPEEATYIAFFDDGEATFIDGSFRKGEGLIPNLGQLTFVSTSIYKDVRVEIED
jgi:hypothetical protein